MIRRAHVYALAVILASLALVYCAEAPYTDRPQFIILPRSQEASMGASAAKDILKKEKLSTNQEEIALVERVGKRIAAVADAPDFKWEFHVIDKPDTVNAFCLPGGKVFVYTGLFKVATTEDDLATVMGHEISHAIARHGAERLSQAQALSVAGTVGAAAIGASTGSSAASQAFQTAYGLGANVGILLPFSRTQESEADHIGLILMAKAGYDPHRAVDFWYKMAENSKKQGKQVPAYLATHPSDQQRIDDIKKLIPEAMSYYKRG
jgi:predicted Zn-dependent protease